LLTERTEWSWLKLSRYWYALGVDAPEPSVEFWRTMDQIPAIANFGEVDSVLLFHLHGDEVSLCGGTLLEASYGFPDGVLRLERR
jgi:hypothetical protein